MPSIQWYSTRYSTFRAMRTGLLLGVAFACHPLSLHAQATVRPAVVTAQPYSDLSQAFALAVDASGNIFFTRPASGILAEKPISGGAEITLATGLSYPKGVATDTAGNIYVTSYDGSLQRVPAGGGTAVNLIANCGSVDQGYVGPQSVATDSSGNVYFVGVSGTGTPPNTSGSAVYSVTQAGVCSIVVTSTQLNSGVPTNVASDPTGDVSYALNGQLYTLLKGATAPVLVNATFGAINGLRADKYGNVFVSDSNTIDEVPFVNGALDGTKMVAVLNNSSSYDIGIDTSGVLYTTDTTTITESTLGSVWAVSSGATLARLNEAGDAVNTGTGTAGTTSTYAGVAFDVTGNVWSVTSANNRLAFNSKTGTAATTYTGGGISTPVSIAVDGSGALWIANAGNNSVSLFNNSGVAQSATTGLGTASIAAPSAVALDGTGGVWITNQTANTVTHLFGAATPVVRPITVGVAAGTLGTKP